MAPVITIQNVSKRYSLGQVGAQTMREEVERLGMRLRGKRASTAAAAAAEQRATEFWALRDVSFSVEAGEMVGIIGRNGAGKSTLLKILSQVTEPTSGEIRLRGRVGSLLEVGTGFHPELTGRENIFLNGAILGMTRADVRARFDEIVAFAEVDKFLDTPVKRYSSGMHVRLAFAVAAHLEPEILIVDEVLAVGDVEFQKKCLGKMQEAKSQRGRTVIFVSHNISAVKELCTRAVLIESGRVKRDGSVADVVRDYLSTASADPDVDLTSAQQQGPQLFSRLHRLRLMNDAGAPTTTFATGAPLVARIQIELKARTPRVEVGLRVSSRYGAVVHCITSSWEGLSPTLEPGLHWFQVRVPALTLYPGTYLIGAWVLRANEWGDSRVQDVSSIEVLKGNVTPAPHRMEEYVASGCEVYVPSEWSLLADEPRP